MEVILVKPIRKLGQIGEVLTVADGYGRNYLLPQKLAIRATKSNRDLVDSQKQALLEDDLLLKQKLEKVSESIRGKEIVFVRQSSDDGRLFGSVSSKEIAEELTKLAACTISHMQVVLDKPIKSIGVLEVEIRLHAEVSSVVTVVIARSESEAQDYLHKNSEQPLEESSK